MDTPEYDTLLRTLVQIAAHQDTINADLRAMLRAHDATLTHQTTLLTQQVEINTDVKTTLARLEALLARMIRQGENGREA